MYLMSITNIDYVWISIFFGVFALIAYKFRRYNQTSDVFLNTQVASDSLIYIFGTIGVFDIVLSGYLGSKLGLNVFYLASIAVVINELLLKNKLCKLYQKHNVNNFNSYIETKLGKVTAFIVSIVHVLFMLSLIVLTMFLTAKLFYNLTGWNFINSIVGVTGLAMICAIIGGVTALNYNKLIQIAIIMIGILIVIFLAINHQGGVQDILNQLSKYAALQHKPETFYTHISLLSMKNIMFLVVFIFVFFGMHVLGMHLGSNQTNNTKKLTISLITVCMLFVLMIPGVLAISAKTTSRAVHGTRVVTIQTQFSDGQTGYIVRAVNNDSNKKIITPGIIPARIAEKSNVIVHKGYDYFLATVVLFRHYLPPYFQFLIILVIFAGFILALSTYLTTLCRILLSNIIVPTQWIDKYGDIGRLWTIRLSIIGVSVISLIIANFIPHSFNFLYGLMWALVIFVAPLLGMLFLALITHKKCSGYIGLLFGIAISTLMMLKFHTPSLINKCAAVSMFSCLTTVVTGYIVCILNI